MRTGGATDRLTVEAGDLADVPLLERAVSHVGRQPAQVQVLVAVHVLTTALVHDRARLAGVDAHRQVLACMVHVIAENVTSHVFTPVMIYYLYRLL